MNLRFIDWIWCVRGSVPLASDLSTDKAFEKLNALFQVPGTTYDRVQERLVFQKKNQPSQDKMSIFDSGVLSVEASEHGRRLRYNLVSRTLLLCFLAPALFFGFAKVFEFTREHQKPALVTSASHSAGSSAVVDDKKNPAEKKDAVPPMNSIDKFLGAPAPDKKDDAKDEEKKAKKLSPTPAYVFCGLFAFLYVVGRILEQILIKREFTRAIGLAVVLGLS
ncbi:hypothetical protein BAR24_10590 [Gluconobacter oxydans]|nr:hypothetical protein BAR24_10590 [Gluconobacter oxydans]